MAKRYLQTVDEKAKRYLLERRVVILGRRRGAVFAEVQGSAAEPYSVRFARGRWACTCPAWMRCAHVAAVEYVCPSRSFDGPGEAA